MMSNSNLAVDSPAKLGGWGERFAADYLTGLGWRVVERNWRCQLGEIDLVCLEPSGDELPTAVLVEVKCRSGRGFGDPLEAITYAKRQRLRQLAATWCRLSGIAVAGLRVDAVGILKIRGAAPLVRHVRGVA